MNLCSERDIKALLNRHGFKFSKALGQNFLKEAWIPEDIAESAMLDDNTAVLEIGPGIGCLTEQLAKNAAKVLCIEADKSLEPILKETVGDFENVSIIFGDCMKEDFSLIVEQHFKGLRPVVCANLPYSITSPVITKLLECRCFQSITVMIQREVAQRICAKPGDKAYGSFSVFVNWYAQPEMLFDVSPGCFIPAPKVTSTVIRLTTRPEPPVAVIDEKLFFRVVRAAFGQRRKTLKNALSQQLTRERVERAIAGCGLDPLVRGETLGIESFAELANWFSRNL